MYHLSSSKQFHFNLELSESIFRSRKNIFFSLCRDDLYDPDPPAARSCQRNKNQSWQHAERVSSNQSCVLSQEQCFASNIQSVSTPHCFAWYSIHSCCKDWWWLSRERVQSAGILSFLMKCKLTQFDPGGLTVPRFLLFFLFHVIGLSSTASMNLNKVSSWLLKLVSFRLLSLLSYDSLYKEWNCKIWGLHNIFNLFIYIYIKYSV